jgi:HAD superfamily hydrolase (TIGR01549 family)
LKSINLRSYKAVVFDLDSTLTDTHRYPLRASKWLLGHCVDDVDGIAREYISQLIANYRKGIDEIVAGAPYRTPFDIIKRAIRETLTSLDLPVDEGLIEEGTKLFRWLHVETSTAYPGVEELLTSLKERGKVLGSVTNSFENHIELVLSKLNLMHFFSCLVDGGDVKAYKPMPAPFEKVLECMSMKAEEVLYVGDEYYSDIVGASGVGMDAVWVNSRNASVDEAVSEYGESTRPILTIDSVEKLRQYLDPQ